ncbi:hypothetical protein WJX84_005594 [Apatococcus fuscideae]|uniref:Kinesin-like protein n=1 Tax=Apatococcus fuscideae TaxID=2026836 RepID=A0AAW1T4F9_9CHLO
MNITKTLMAENSRIESEAALQSVVKELQSELTEQQQMWWRLEADCRNLSTLLAQANHEKRMLINQLLDLKGSIRVICRIRPLMSSDALTAATSSSSILEIPTPDTLILAPDRTERTLYDFDRVIGPSEGQEEVFNEARSLVDSVVEGYNRGKAARASSGPEGATRSHLVLTIYVTCTHRSTEASSTGKLHLVDLAGSERIAKGAASAERTKEAQAIHKSLTALGDVMQALQQKSSHVPFRNSKLTRLLEDSVGFNSRTMVVLTCSPAAEDAAETRSTLEFGLKARKTETLSRQGSTSPKRHFLKALRSTNE